MVRRQQRQRSLWEVVLPDAAKSWPADLRRIDALVEAEAGLEPIVTALEARWGQSRRRGRPGTPAEVVLRMLLPKHLYRWSFDTLEHEVRSNLVYRAFARVGAEAVPDAKTILKIARVLGPEVIAQVHARVVQLAVAHGVTRGRRLWIDTTVVETHVHYPTDSSLLADRVRVLTRTMRQPMTLVGHAGGQVRNRVRSVTRRCLAIARASRSATTCPALVRGYRRLLAITRAVLREARTTIRRLGQGRRRGVGGAIDRAQRHLRETSTLVTRVIDQTRRRLFGGDTHVPAKVLSLFEPHTEAIRNGKLVKPTEFCNLVTIQEAEHQIISYYAVHATRPADVSLCVPALYRHQRIFGRPTRRGDRRSRLLVGRQRGGGHGPRRPARRLAARRHEDDGSPGARTAVVVSAGDAVADWL